MNRDFDTVCGPKPKNCLARGWRGIKGGGGFEVIIGMYTFWRMCNRYYKLSVHFKTFRTGVTVEQTEMGKMLFFVLWALLFSPSYI